MITRIRIEGYKSLKAVELEPRPLSVFFGPNAAGKSNLFDALGLLSRMVSQPTLHTAFSAWEYRGTPLESFYYADRGIEGIFESPHAEFTLTVDVKLSDTVVGTIEDRIEQLREQASAPRPRTGNSRRRTVTQRYLRYSLTVRLATESGVLTVASEDLVALDKNGRPKESVKPFIETSGNRIILRRERGAGRPSSHEVGLDYTLVSRPLYAPHYPHINAFKEELSRWRIYYLEPSLLRETTPIRVVENIGPRGEDLAGFFNYIKTRHPRTYDAINRAARQLIPGLEKIDILRTDDGFLHLVTFQDGILYSARVMSEGTLRIIALLAITNSPAPPTLICYEEPENGVHPRRIGLVAKVLENASRPEQTQIFANTHSPIFLEAFDEEALFVCQKVRGETSFVPFASLGPLFRDKDIAKAFEETAFSERLTRGDYGG